MLYNKDMDIFIALAEPTERTIVEILARSGPFGDGDIRAISCQLSGYLEHLKVLREAKLVLMEKRSSAAHIPA